MPDRIEVYGALDSERAYQDSRWGSKQDGKAVSGSSGFRPEAGGDRTIDEFVCYIAAYTNQLVNIAGTTADPKGKLDAIRKVSALGVACMEQHGAPRREGF